MHKSIKGRCQSLLSLHLLDCEILCSEIKHADVFVPARQYFWFLFLSLETAVSVVYDPDILIK